MFALLFSQRKGVEKDMSTFPFMKLDNGKIIHYISRRTIPFESTL